MKRFLVLAVLAALLVAGNAFALEKGKTFVNGFDGGGFPPYASIDKDGKVVGFDIEAVEWIAKKMGFTVKHQPIDWDGIIPALLAKKIDFIASGMSATEERAQKVNFTIPCYTVTQVLVTKKDEKATLAQFLTTGKKIGVQRGTVTAKLVKELAAKPGNKIEVVEYDSTELSMQDLPTGRIDGSGMDSTIAAEMLRKKDAFKLTGTFEAKPENYAYAVRKEDKDLTDALNQGLKLLMADPFWKELKKKYKVE
jgi:polar amino acid transport system substrate-binding protein